MAICHWSLVSTEKSWSLFQGFGRLACRNFVSVGLSSRTSSPFYSEQPPLVSPNAYPYLQCVLAARIPFICCAHLRSYRWVLRGSAVSCLSNDTICEGWLRQSNSSFDTRPRLRSRPRRLFESRLSGLARHRAAHCVSRDDLGHSVS